LWLVDPSVHEGWNEHDFEDDDKPSHNIYRFKGSQPGSCRIGEISLYGIESIDDDEVSYTCTPKLILEGEDSSAELNAVTFADSVTPVLTGMSTRFGSVLGHELVEFYGTNFSIDAKTTVMIDNRVCAVDT